MQTNGLLTVQDPYREGDCEMCEATAKGIAQQLAFYRRHHPRDIRLEFRDELSRAMDQQICLQQSSKYETPGLHFVEAHSIHSQQLQRKDEDKVEKGLNLKWILFAVAIVILLIIVIMNFRLCFPCDADADVGMNGGMTNVISHYGEAFSKLY